MDLKIFSFDFKFLSFFCLVFLLNNKTVISWDNHNITTLRLLQVVHRHGDRTVTKIYPNDPFSNLTEYWPEGLGELTNQGKYRMYKLGQFIRQEYQQYLGSNYSPREVYARSSAKGRCLESLSSLLSGAYPPNNDEWKWDNGTDSQVGQYWQPIPIYTVPIEHMDGDRLLRTEANCPKAVKEMIDLENSQLVQSSLQNETEFLEELSKFLGVESISTTLDAKNVYDHLLTEYDRGLRWSDFDRWSPEYEEKIFEKLLPLTELLWTTEWNSSAVQRTRAGPLIHELTMNLKDYLKSAQNSRKLYLYSTHDAMVAVLMHSLQVFNNRIIPLSASLFFELHENPISSDYFVRLYYYNETLTDKSPHLLRLLKCDYLDDCPIDKFFKLTDELIPEDWHKECQISSGHQIETSLLHMLILISLIIYKT